MVFFKWEKKYELGIKSIDDQHKKIVELINKIYSAFTEKKADSALRLVLKEMEEYAQFHFSYEEKILKSLNYTFYDNHIAEHHKFAEKVAEFKNKLENGNFPMTFTILNFLKDWLTNHILVVDAKYTTFMTQNGIN